MKTYNFRAPLTSGVSQYDLETGICMLDSLQLFEMPVSEQARVEFVHETAHWLTEAKTSIGQFLVFLKGTRDQDLFHGLAISPALKELYRRRLDQGRQGAPIIPGWMDDTTVQVTGGEEDGLLDKWVGNYKAEAVLLHHYEMPMPFMDKLAYLSGAIEEYSNRLNDEVLLNNRGFGAREADIFIKNSAEKHYHLASCIEDSLHCETIDLMEAVAVCSELLWASRQGNYAEYAALRLRLLAETSYTKPIGLILAELGEELTPASALKFIKLIIMVLDCSLNPPIPPIENFDFSQWDWTHLFPPMRFNRALWTIGRPGFLDSFVCDATYASDTDWQFQLTIYRALDPPGRDFGLRIVESADLDPFCLLPERLELENMFIWVNNGRLLTPYLLRLWSANQLRLATVDAGLPDLTRTLLAPDLRLVSRLCEPVVTLRSQAILPGSQAIPANSQLLNQSEVLEWFMVLSGLHYAGAAFLTEFGKPNLAGYIQGKDFEKSEWLPQLRLRSEAFLDSILRVS